jgi:iron-sulfur cluster repair protein YtfE (RIC family)
MTRDIEPAWRQLLDTHTTIDLLLSQLCNQAEANVRPELEQTWDELERTLLLHLEHEELYLFPTLAREDRTEHDALARDHAEFRRLLAEIGVGVELHCVRLEVLRALAERLTAHAKREDETLYRLAARSEEAGPRALVRRLRRRLAGRG